MGQACPAYLSGRADSGRRVSDMGYRRYGAVVTADAVSSRMGKIISMLPLGNESIIQRTIRLLKNQGVNDIVVVTGYRRDAMEKHLKDCRVTCVYNRDFSTSSIYDSYAFGYEHLDEEADRIFFIQGGHPVLGEDTFALMSQTEGRIVIPECMKDTGHPALFERSIVGELISSAALKNGNDILAEFKDDISRIGVNDEGIVMKLDTKQDYEVLLQIFYERTGQKPSLRMELDLKIGTGELFFGKDTALFLELISVTGSISSACHAMNISYTKGWKMINKVEERFDRKVLLRNVGGNDGGGCVLTKDGKYLLNAYKYMESELEDISSRMFSKLFKAN